MGREAKQKVRAPRYRRAQPDPASQPGRSGRDGTAPRTQWYIWRVAPEDEGRTRADHLRLNGRLFRWDDPPVHDTQTGARGHPGADPHCRCYAEPVDKPSEAVRKYGDGTGVFG